MYAGFFENQWAKVLWLPALNVVNQKKGFSHVDIKNNISDIYINIPVRSFSETTIKKFPI